MTAQMLSLDKRGSPETWRCRIGAVRLKGMDNVLGGIVTRLDSEANFIIASALEQNLEEVLIIGMDKDGEEYFAGNISDGGAAVWHLMRAAHKLMVIADHQDTRDAPRIA